MRVNNEVKLLFLFFLFAIGCISCNADKKEEDVFDTVYIETKSIGNIPVISVTNIADFSKLINDYKVNHIFFTDSVFFFQVPSIAYPYSIPSNGYKNIEDYLTGSEKLFNDGASFYYANDNQLNSQEEVDYYKQESYFSPQDYRKAQQEGFIKPDVTMRMNKITGVISEKNLQDNLYYANAIIWLLYYQKTDPVKEFLKNEYIDKLLLPFVNIKSYPNYIVRFKPGFYFVNLDISSLPYRTRDAVFFYAAKFSLYASLEDYKTNYNTSVSYTIKDSETTARQMGYATYQECLNDVNKLIRSSF